MVTRTRTTWIYDAGLILVVLVWGFNFSIIKASLAHIHPFVFNALRFSIATLFLGVLYLRERRTMDGPPFRWFSKTGVQIIALGIMANVIYQLAFMLGIDRTTAGNAALLVTSAPLWTALLGHVLNIEKLRIAAWIGLGIACIGTIQLALVRGDVDFGQQTLVGNLFCAASAVAWGSYTTLSKSFLRTFTPTGLSYWAMVIALPFLWAAAVPYLDATPWSDLGWKIWGAVAYSGLLAIGVAYLFWNVSIHHVGPAQTAIYAYLVPVVAVLSGAVWLNEPVSPQQLLGGSLVIGGLVWMRRSSPP